MKAYIKHTKLITLGIHAYVWNTLIKSVTCHQGRQGHNIPIYLSYVPQEEFLLSTIMHPWYESPHHQHCNSPVLDTNPYCSLTFADGQSLFEHHQCLWTIALKVLPVFINNHSCCLISAYRQSLLHSHPCWSTFTLGFATFCILQTFQWWPMSPIVLTCFINFPAPPCSVMTHGSISVHTCSHVIWDDLWPHAFGFINFKFHQQVMVTHGLSNVHTMR